MSACEVTTVEGFESELNQKQNRVELSRKEYYGFTVDQFITDGKSVYKIARFIDAAGQPSADVRKWMGNPNSPMRKHLKQVRLFGEEEANYQVCADPREEKAAYNKCKTEGKK